MLLPFNELPGTSRIWVYMSDREFSKEETDRLKDLTSTFLEEWTSHQKALKAGFDIRYNRFLIVAVDEAAVAAGGCSIDKSVGFIRNLEPLFGIRLMDRLLFGYKEGDTVKAAHKDDFEVLTDNGAITNSTIVFDNLVDTIDALNHRWQIPFERSWHKVLVG